MKKTFIGVGGAALFGAAIGALIARWHLQALLAWLRLDPGMCVSALIWVAFSLYWTVAAKDSKAAATSESFWSRQLHVIWVNVAILILVLPVPGLTRRFLPVSWWLIGAGLAIQAAFTLLAVWGRRHLGGNWSGEVRIAAGHQLVTTGPYRVVRHPIYTAVLGMYLGTMLVSGEIHALVAMGVVMAAYWRKIRMEERALGQAFGAAFREYQRETWAWVPLVY